MPPSPTQFLSLFLSLTHLTRSLQTQNVCLSLPSSHDLMLTDTLSLCMFNETMLKDFEGRMKRKRKKERKKERGERRGKYNNCTVDQFVGVLKVEEEKFLFSLSLSFLSLFFLSLSLFFPFSLSLSFLSLSLSLFPLSLSLLLDTANRNKRHVQEGKRTSHH